MKDAFILSAIVFAVTALIIYFINKKQKSVVIGNICFLCIVCSVLLVGCIALDVDKLLTEDRSTQYHEITTTASTTKRNNGRPVKKQTTTTKPHTNGQNNSLNNNIVYITKSGKKYHLDYTCGGNEYYECTLNQALDRGLTPCKKCTQ